MVRMPDGRLIVRITNANATANATATTRDAIDCWVDDAALEACDDVDRGFLTRRRARWASANAETTHGVMFDLEASSRGVCARECEW